VPSAVWSSYCTIAYGAKEYHVVNGLINA